MIYYGHRFTVRRLAGGDFPIDMLRYDHVSPLTESDAALIEAAEAGPIHLTRIDGRLWQPTEARWRSFGWAVVPGSHQMAKLP